MKILKDSPPEARRRLWIMVRSPVQAQDDEKDEDGLVTVHL